MNDAHFEAALRRSFPAPAPTETLDEKVQSALARHTRRRAARHRIVFGFAATGATVLAFVAFPAVQSQAAIGGIFRALDRQTRVKVATFNVDEQGRRWPMATTTIADGDIAYVDAHGTRQTFDVGTKTYNFDPTIGRFIVRPRRPGGSIRLSDMLNGASGFSLGKRAEVQKIAIDGRELLHATILNNGLPERYQIDADPKTELPVRVQVEAKERNAWRLRTEMAFDYDAGVVALEPDLKRYPPTTEQEANAEFEAAATKPTLAAVPLKKHRLVVRSVDVAEDGTVFVLFQTGNHLPRSWNGYTFEVTDDLGNVYDAKSQIFNGMEGPFRSPDGKLELEMFVPLRPVAPNRPRVIALSTHKDPNGELLKLNEWFEVRSDGSKIHHWSEGVQIPVLTKRFAASTCGSYPAYAARIDQTRFGNPIAAEMAKAHQRAQNAMDRQDWPEAETQLNEELRLKHEHERQGYSPWVLSDTLENLDKVHAAMRPKP